ncbi:hypothetical protein [Actinoplanes sp. N902-109]|uniref:hypothetical protein n=1 Tax=Actinoplanes sp. (strain N902-109) TaxID=649831 RepID=UPI000329599C|nr:hypothetical protein [Actinoplanes sp. N902-109]AGL13855.1 hypothetical protein L083_0345 [Actinoplanes sp. N902-109]
MTTSVSEVMASLAGNAAPPASTVGELRQILIDYEASRPRSMQKALGPSELGTPCQQQIARKYAQAPRRPVTDPTWAPFQGTAMHAAMEDVLRHWNAALGRERWIIEDRLEPSPAAPGVDGGVDLPAVAGSGDAFDLDQGMVVDWKYVGKSAIDKLLTARRLGKPAKEQVSQEYRIQAHIYGLGHAAKGRDVRHVRLVLLARDWQYDTSAEWTEPYDERIAIWAIGRYYDVVTQVAELALASHPDQIVHIASAPSSDACKWCPFHRPGRDSDWSGCRGYEPTAQRATSDWLATLPSSGATSAPAR